MAAAARSAVRSSTARLSTSIFRSPIETSCINGGSISIASPRNLSTFSAKTRRFRFNRTIDLKRSTSATGIVERIEYDPNRNSRIALVRWDGELLQRRFNSSEEVILPEKKVESTAAAAIGTFAFSSLPGLVDERNVPYFSNGDKQAMRSKYVMVGLPARMASLCKSEDAGSMKASAKEVIVSAFSRKSNGENAGVGSVGSPRIAVAGSRPAYFVLGEKGEMGGKETFALGELQKWKKDSSRWAHRIKRKGAVSWQNLMGQELGSGHKVSKAKKETGAKNGKFGDDRVPVTYIIASHQLGRGNLVMNWSESSDSATSRTAQYSY